MRFFLRSGPCKNYKLNPRGSWNMALWKDLGIIKNCILKNKNKRKRTKELRVVQQGYNKMNFHGENT